MTEYNFRNGVISRQILNSVKVVLFLFALTLTFSEILMFQFFHLQKVDQGRGVQFSHFGGKYQNLQKSFHGFLTLALTIPGALIFQILNLKQVGQSRRVKFSR